MKKTLLKGLALAVVGMALLAGSSSASMMSGGVSLSGGWIPVGLVGDLTTITGIDFGGAFVTGVAGDFTGAFGTPVTMVDVFNFSDPLPVTDFWQYTFLTDTFSFDFYSMTVLDLASNTVEIEGTGLLYGTGYDPTPGTFVLTGNSGGGTYSFSVSNAVVPEPATMLLFGAGLAGLAGVRRKMDK